MMRLALRPRRAALLVAAALSVVPTSASRAAEHGGSEPEIAGAGPAGCPPATGGDRWRDQVSDDESWAHPRDRHRDRHEPVDHGCRCPEGHGEHGGGCPKGHGEQGCRCPKGHGEKTRPEAGPVEPLVLGAYRFLPTGQYRLRYRHQEGHDFAPGAVTDQLRHRARLGVQSSYRQWLGARFEIQDVRAFGEEASVTDASADGFDMHQAYASIAPLGALELRLGRQEIGYGNERLVGKSDWAEQGRVFDALRFAYAKDGTRADLFWALVHDGTASPAGLDGKQQLGGVLLGHRVLSALDASVLAVVDVDSASGKRMVTVGSLLTGEVGGVLAYSLDGYYQGGKLDTGHSQAAFLVAGEVRATLDLAVKPYLELYASFLSGDDDLDDPTARTFVTPFATGHKFHGMMDVFIEMRGDTSERGLRDIGGALGVAPIEGLSVRGAHHLFQAMQERGDVEHFGHELDLTAGWRFVSFAGVDAGYGVFFPGNIMDAEVRAAGGGGARPEHFVYATADVSF
jgi:hypothetical protein